MADTIKKYLDQAGLEQLVTKIKAEDAATLEAAKGYSDGLADNYDAAGSATTAESNAKAYAKEYTDNLANGQVKTNTDAITAINEDMGSVDNLATTSKVVVDAINEVRNSVSAGGTAAAVTMTTDTTTDGALKSYTIKQGDNTVGVIDIPKDMVVESGEVVVNPDGQTEGTYIKLILANVTEPLFINVGTLVDIYKAKASATQVQIAIDSSTREISATIVAGSVGSTEIADNAVTTIKIADANVTMAKLSSEIQTILDSVAGKAEASHTHELDDIKNMDAIQANVNELFRRADSLDEVVGGHSQTLSNIVDIDLPAKADKTDTYTKTEVDNAIKVVDDKIGDVGDTTVVAEIARVEGKVDEFTAITTAEVDALFTTQA